MKRQGFSGRAFRTANLLWLALFGLAGCAIPGNGGPSPDPEAVYTAAAGTLQAQLDMALTATQANIFTREAGLPTQTLTPPATAEEEAVPVLEVSIETNCRSGPNIVYHTVSVLDPAEKHEVIGRSEDGTWYVLNGEGSEDDVCWVLQSENVTLTGSIFGVPFYAPPPPPTATLGPTPEIGYGFFYTGTRTCQGSGRHAQFVIRNTGPVTFVSAQLTIRNTTTDVVVSNSSSNTPYLTNEGDCPPGGSSFPPGATMYLSGPTGSGGPGDSFAARARLCTERGLRGTCINRSASFVLHFD